VRSSQSTASPDQKYEIPVTFGQPDAVAPPFELFVNGFQIQHCGFCSETGTVRDDEAHGWVWCFALRS